MTTIIAEARRMADEHNRIYPQDQLTVAECYETLVRRANRDADPRIESVTFNNREDQK